MESIMIVAAKEFRDHITSKRFLLIFNVLILLSVVGILAGVGDYNRELSHYKDQLQQQSADPAYQKMIADLQQQIANAEASGFPQDQIDNLKQTLAGMVSPPMPSVLLVFRNFNLYFTIFGAVMAASLGFDLITREKEEGSLKSLLTHPVYRDEVINGKALGSIAVLAIALLSTFLLTVAVMMISGITPGVDDFLSLVAYLAIALVYATVFFGISLAASTVARSSGMSVAYFVGIVILLVLAPLIINTLVVFAMGQPPEMNMGLPAPTPVTGGESSAFMSGVQAGGSVSGMINQTTYEDPGKKYAEYWRTRALITGIVDVINPISDLSVAAGAVLDKNGGSVIGGSSDGIVIRAGELKRISLLESLAVAWANILMLIAMAVAALGYAYVKFMRLDVR
jgi:ABC-2 type transport system permease protein